MSYDPSQEEVSEIGTITADDLEGAMTGDQLSDLIDAMKNGDMSTDIQNKIQEVMEYLNVI